MKKKVDSKWYVRGALPHVPVCTYSKRKIDKYYTTDLIPATVPGGVHMDLYNAGIIENPYFEENSLHCEWTEHRWWIYQTVIPVNETASNKKYIVFEGLDYLCEIFINGESYGEHENMFTEKRIDISHITTDSIEVIVLFKGVVNELGQFGATSDTRTQKSRFGYGWDFATRLVNIGIWRDVFIEYIDDVRLLEAKVYTDVRDSKGIIDAEFIFEGETSKDIRIEVVSPGGKIISEKILAFKNTITEIFEVENPELWYPNGMGEHPLYKLVVSCGSEKYEYKIGIRSLRYLMNPESPEDAHPYTIEINGKNVYLKGNNKVPLDHLYGNVSLDTYEWLIKALVNENVNIVRAWGGGIIETEEFYNLCDENGIMVWQDFIQSSSGVENEPSSDEGFLAKLKDAAIAAVKTKRNHVSLTVWTGGNELVESPNFPVTYNHVNIAMLKDVVKEYDPQRYFYPSTPSGPVYGLKFDREDNYDVHGPWEYEADTHYTNYNKLKLFLHSEFGISGPSASTALFVKENKSDAPKHNANVHHGEFWWESYRRDKNYFGAFDSCDDYVPYGQWMQAEGLRYIIENERRNAPRVSGSIIWQVNEPWPNTDCTNILDYFGNPKMAYYWAKNSFSDCNVSLKYDSAYFEKTLKAEICAQKDMTSEDENFDAIVFNDDGKILKEYKLNVTELPVNIEADFEKENQILTVRLTHRGVNKDYCFSNDKEFVFRPSRSFKKAKLSYETGKFEKSGMIFTGKAKVKNTGDTTAYFVNVKDKNMNYAILASDGFFTLLPGEEKEIEITMRERTGLFFEKPDADPEIVFECLNY